MQRTQPPDSRAARSMISIRALRRLILVVLTVSVLAFTAGVFGLVRQIFDNFGPAVLQDLYWTTNRGAQELAHAADVGLAVRDPGVVTSAFGEYRRLADVVAIAAIDSTGAVLAVHGNPPEPMPSLFSGSPTQVRAMPGYLVAWAPAAIEGAIVGKVAIAISTRRLVESERLLRRMSVGTAIAGGAALLFGILFINFFTRSIVERDQQLARYASGLESKVAERTAELDRMNRGMRLVLDNVHQGFVIIAFDGTMWPERSAIVDRWFGVAAPNATLPDYIRPVAPDAAEWLTLGLESLVEDVLPRELVLSQFPQRLTCGQRTLSLAYIGISSSGVGAFNRLLVVMTDITDELARERMEHDNQELIQIFTRASTDRAGTESFFAEAEQLVQKLVTGQSPQIEKRLVHTLKGNCAMFGIDSVAQLCHAAESQMEMAGGALLDSDRRSISTRWNQVVQLVRELVGERRATLELTPADLDELIGAVERGAPKEQIVRIARNWRHEPVAVRFARLADNAKQTARRLRKPVTVNCESSGLRLDPARWAPFWSALVHAINNAVDHGIEAAEPRAAANKPANGTIWLRARREGAELVIAVSDDGRGIDWDGLALRARSLGLPHANREDLVAALFADGVSTRTEATTTSGRGIGLAALAEATEALGGRIDVTSDPGLGTTLACHFPDVWPAGDPLVRIVRADA
jgi:signal transduction histidine kinase